MYMILLQLGMGLDNAAEKYLSYKTIHNEDIAGKGAKQIPFSKSRY